MEFKPTRRQKFIKKIEARFDPFNKPKPKPRRFKEPEPYVSTDPGDYWEVTEWDDEFNWRDKEFEIRQINCNKYKDVDPDPPTHNHPASIPPTQLPPCKPSDPEFRLYKPKLALHEYCAIADPNYQSPPVDPEEFKAFEREESWRAHVMEKRKGHEGDRIIFPAGVSYRARKGAMPPDPRRILGTKPGDPLIKCFMPTPYDSDENLFAWDPKILEPNVFERAEHKVFEEMRQEVLRKRKLVRIEQIPQPAIEARVVSKIETSREPQVQPTPEIKPAEAATEYLSNPSWDENEPRYFGSGSSGSGESSVLSWMLNPHRDPLERRPKKSVVPKQYPMPQPVAQSQIEPGVETRPEPRVQPTPGIEPTPEVETVYLSDPSSDENEAKFENYPRYFGSGSSGSGESSVLSWLMNPERDPLQKRPKTKTRSQFRFAPVAKIEHHVQPTQGLSQPTGALGICATPEIPQEVVKASRPELAADPTLGASSAKIEPLKMTQTDGDSDSSGSGDSSVLSWLMNPHRDPLEKRPKKRILPILAATPQAMIEPRVKLEVQAKIGTKIQTRSEPATQPTPEIAPTAEDKTSDPSSSEESSGSGDSSVLSWLLNPHRDPLEKRPKKQTVLREHPDPQAMIKPIVEPSVEPIKKAPRQAQVRPTHVIEQSPEVATEHLSDSSSEGNIKRDASAFKQAQLETQFESEPKPQDPTEIKKHVAFETRPKFQVTPVSVSRLIARTVTRRKVAQQSIEDGGIEIDEIQPGVLPSMGPRSAKNKPKVEVRDENIPMMCREENLNDDRSILFARLNWPGSLIRVMLVCILGTLPIGYQSTIMSNSWRMQDRWLDEWWWTWVDRDNTPDSLFYRKELVMLSYYTVFSLGAVIGAYRARFYIKRHGVKRTLMKSAFWATLAHIGMSITNLIQYISCLYLGRICIGIYCGINSVAVPIYLLEATRGDMRGPCFAICAISYAAGIMLSSLLSHHEYLGNQSNLDAMMGVTVPCMWIQFLLLWRFVPASPRHLFIMCGRTVPAFHIFENLVGRRMIVQELMIECAREVNYVIYSYPQLNYSKVTAYRHVFEVPGLRKAWPVAIKLACVWQIAAFNCFIGSCSKILENKRGWEAWEVAPRTVIIYGVSMFFWSLFTIKLMQKCGRKCLLLGGLFGMAIAQSYQTFVLSYYSHDFSIKAGYYSLTMIPFTMSYVFGPLMIPPLYLVEMFTQDTRYPVVSLATTAGWHLNLILMTLVYPICDWALGRFFLVPGILATCWSIYFVITELYETRGMSMIQIHECFREKKFDQMLLIHPVPSARRIILKENHRAREARWQLQDAPFRALLVEARKDEKVRQDKIRTERVAMGLRATPPPLGVPDILVSEPEEGPPEFEN